MKPTIKRPQNGYSKIEDIDLASWQDLISMNENRLLELETNSLNLIREKSLKYSNHIPLIPVSMGKDSMVTCFLVRKCFPKTKAIFNNTFLKNKNADVSYFLPNRYEDGYGITINTCQKIIKEY